MGKFFKDLPSVVSLENNTLFAVSDDTTIKTYKTSLQDISDFITPSPSGAEARMSSNLVMSSGVTYILPYNTKRYDIIGTEFNTSAYAFEPTRNGLYLTTITIGLSSSPSWMVGDRVEIHISTGSVTTGTVWNTIYGYPTTSSGDLVMSCSGVVRITDYTNIQIRGGVCADFGGIPTREIKYNWTVSSSSVGYSNIQVTKV